MTYYILENNIESQSNLKKERVFLDLHQTQMTFNFGVREFLIYEFSLCFKFLKLEVLGPSGP